MENMPTRIIFTKTINDSDLISKQIKVGTIMDANTLDFEEFKKRYPGCFTVIEMTEQDWIDLATENFVDSKRKLDMLTSISEGMGLGITVDDTIYYYTVPETGTKVNPQNYGGGLSDVYYKSTLYKGFVDEFERRVGEQLSPAKPKTL
ncbi:MAG: hypothetical protein J6A52_01890 [Bacilli bacterium]|nr:hypothetical protein [Bacilli bacterium]